MNLSLLYSSWLPLVYLDSCDLPFWTRVSTNDLGEWPHSRFLLHPPFPKFYPWDPQTSKWTRTQITLCTSCKYEVRINTADTSLSGCRILESGKTLVDIGDIITWCLCWKQGRDKQKRTAIFFFHGATAPSGPGPPHYRRFMIILRHTTLGRIPLDEWSARRRETSTSQHTTLTTDGHPWRRRDSNPQS